VYCHLDAIDSTTLLGGYSLSHIARTNSLPGSYLPRAAAHLRFCSFTLNLVEIIPTVGNHAFFVDLRKLLIQLFTEAVTELFDD